MLQQLFYSALSTVFDLAFAAVPVLPLLGKKWPSESAVKNIVQVPGGRGGLLPENHHRIARPQTVSSAAEKIQIAR
jgi:hypothetical protein